MTVGIVGTGLIGANLARLLARAGHQVIVSFSRDPQKLTALAQELAAYKVRVGSPAEAVSQSELIVLSVHFTALDTAISQMGEVGEKILIDTTNPVDIKLPAGVNGGQEIARRLPGTRVVKAFNTLMYDLLIKLSFQEPLTVLPLAGDDPSAKQSVAHLMEQIGFEPLDIGNLQQAGLQEPGGPFFSKIMSMAVAKAILSHQ